jgi:hypothetical protein
VTRPPLLLLPDCCQRRRRVMLRLRLLLPVLWVFQGLCC